jgi:redox-sensitive bicupin YhaK (pirin superfamily)
MTTQIAGEPLDQTVVQYGPFVMTTKEEVQDTLRDCEQSFFP